MHSAAKVHVLQKVHVLHTAMEVLMQDRPRPRSHTIAGVLTRPRCWKCEQVLVAVYRQRGAWNHLTGHRWEKVGLYCDQCKDFSPLKSEEDKT